MAGPAGAGEHLVTGTGSHGPGAAPRIDLNSDSGESFGSWTMGDDAAMAGLASSLNVACGFHAGDPSVARATCRAAVEHGTAIGAHVAYPDLQGFGRRRLEMAHGELVDAVIWQIGALQAIARAEGAQVSYVKPHGALYNVIARERGQAAAVAEGVATALPGAAILVLPGSVIEEEARAAGLRPVREAFADRGYRPDGSLVPRREAGAVLHDPERIAARVLRMVSEGVVEAVDGTPVRLGAESVCVHGDTPDAVGIARAVRGALREAGVEISPFTAA